LYERYTTNKKPEQIREALILSFRGLGGTIQHTREGFNYYNGKYGLPASSTVNVVSHISIRKSADDIYDVQVTITWSMSEWCIACIILGVFIFLFWIVPIMYFTFDPIMSYQQCIYRVQYMLEPQTGLNLR
jgi:hypothetical protein